MSRYTAALRKKRVLLFKKTNLKKPSYTMALAIYFLMKANKYNGKSTKNSQSRTYLLLNPLISCLKI